METGFGMTAGAPEVLAADTPADGRAVAAPADATTVRTATAPQAAASRNRERIRMISSPPSKDDVTDIRPTASSCQGVTAFAVRPVTVSFKTARLTNRRDGPWLSPR
jgi:hypothetical protein